MKTMRFTSLLVLLFRAAGPLQAQIAVSNTAVFNYNGGGEIQSAVIPPGLKPQCSAGRVLISRDGLRPPTTGLVVSRDIGNPAMTPVEATFDLPPNAADYMFNTNDHDLITLPNGDVLYLTGASSKRPLNPKPGWFDNTFRGGFGPGARSVVLTWRSTDGGQSFAFLSEFDPATVEGGVPAYPQIGGLAPGQKKGTPPWDMGGTDGQLVKRLPGSDTLVMTYGVVGYNPVAGAKTFTIDTNSRVSKTVVLLSKGGASWQSLGMMDGMYWRLGIAPLPVTPTQDLRLAFSGLYGNGGVSVGSRTGAQKCTFGNIALPDKPFRYTWRIDSPLGPWIYTNVSATTVLARVPDAGSALVLVYPGTPGNGKNGCHVYFCTVNAANEVDKMVEADPILSEDGSAGSYILHPTLIDSRNGPLLLYWYDLNRKTSLGKIRGRLILGNGTYTKDFDISPTSGVPAGFALTAQPNYWMGDYHTADGYVEPVKVSKNVLQPSTVTAQFFPVWVQPDGTIRYAQVSYTRQTGGLALKNLPNGGITIPLGDWKTVSHIPPREWRMNAIQVVPSHRIEGPETERLQRVPAIRR